MTTKNIRTGVRKRIESVVGLGLKAAGLSKSKAKTIGKKVIGIAEKEHRRIHAALKREAKSEVKKAVAASKREITRIRSELGKGSRKKSKRKR